MKRKNILILTAFLVTAMLIGGFLFVLSSNSINITYEIIDNIDEVRNVKIDAKSSNIFNSNLWISIDSNENETSEYKLYNPMETYDLYSGDYIHIKDDKGNVETLRFDDSEYLDLSFIDLLAFYPINMEIDILKHSSPLIDISSSNENVAYIDNGKVITSQVGTTIIIAQTQNKKNQIELTVTDLYTLEDSNSEDKPFLKQIICSQEDAHKLDDVLQRKIQEAGYQTRAGVVAAARFLSLQFPYKIVYFSESGRLDQTLGTNVSDGEGRYYHKGLYLSEDKFADISESIYGKATWGQYFEEDDTDDHSLDDYYIQDGFDPVDIGSDLYLMKRPNGLDCSGFVSWCYYNGGYDFGDMGAGGPDTYGMSKLGEYVQIDDELLQSNRIKAGDLVGFAAHVGIVIGVEEDYIWIADTLINGLKVTKYERNVESFDRFGEESFKYFMLMDDEYKQDGNYTPMW